ncbi:membrane-bound PQQ-dependent dehydrogenase, glucose/quinate/shikimate family [Photobacterium halotolerans]|uniref:Membrane-bound PQQ-dependent dehydrogenase, glucose/quinate/shikimate family n=1 Tax=Photobacterium halotolerans TaxID=265726 RepID=A0A7X5BLX9_9GAMM|nr:membrane-bound PQQ-dependent dehydrogenase, glucose/quinate/shikimate family [Photobacterium halotolerans]NAW65908.1 membrane-bound PQQ-dependent dehydrogenase, glucose/quinate/shikimate family [Photobacterium halotolerans]NAW86241.1 membrane-bound PQQ-dependent dehydrogenase, glucose/quinate/shikimate family [Photobacterium halotolerans]NAX45966.1 membrane-bound PQQ-dependent dehydrogenase, glucose/quinate/shikimate family [Photobacterium halotolerans]
MGFIAFLYLLIGLVLFGGGLWLISLGGSWYFAVAGVVFLLVAAKVRTKRGNAQILYGLFLLASLIWSLWESGYDWWPLASRMGLLLVLGIPLLFSFRLMGRTRISRLTAYWWLVALVTLGSMFNDTHKLEGQLNASTIVQTPKLGQVPEGDWYSYGRSNLGQRYSPLEAITPQNVGQLEQAWQYQTGDVKRKGDIGEFTYEATPLKIGNTLYLCTPHNWLVALDADSGQQRWVYNAKVGEDNQRQHQTCRGVSYLAPQAGEPAMISQPGSGAAETLASIDCDAQIFLPTSNARLIALDPATGARCKNFAEDGVLDLLHNMPFPKSGYYYSTSPPVVAKGVVVVAGSVNDNYDINSPSGVIRAYDVKTGALKWNWDSANPTDTQPIAKDKLYATSSPNSWSVASADEALGLIYIPMGNRTPDQLGMYRTPEEEKYASSVVALRLDNGQPAWVQQFVHHDLWDMDTPAQPSLLDIQTDSGLVPGLVVPTKQGDVYVLNRQTGEPIHPITEVAAPQGTIDGDFASPTQPESALNFNPPLLEEKDMWGATLIDQLYCRIQFRQLRYEGRYTPPSEQGTIVFPGNFGVFNWGGIAVDPERQVMFGMPLYLAFTSTLIKKDSSASLGEVNVGEHGVNANEGADYAVSLKPFLSPLGVPCQQPPWGYVAGADLSQGKVVYKHRNGTIRDLTPLPLPIEMGVPGIGGPIITKGGVVFMAAAVDNYLRAYDLSDGEEIWKARLPAGGQATPMTYLNSQGEQMVVIVAGGHGSIGTTLGDYIVAFKLKK